MGDLNLFDWLTSGLGGSSASLPGLTTVPGYSAPMTPDQAAMVNQTGYYMRPDAVQPTGSTLPQPAGYSGLTPDQIQAVQQQGFYNQSQPQPPGQTQGMLQQIMSKLGSPAAADAIKQMQSGMQPPKPMGPTTLPVPPQQFSGFGNPAFNIYRRPVLDPRMALKGLLAGT